MAGSQVVECVFPHDRLFYANRKRLSRVKPFLAGRWWGEIDDKSEVNKLIDLPDFFLKYSVILNILHKLLHKKIAGIGIKEIKIKILTVWRVRTPLLVFGFHEFIFSQLDYLLIKQGTGVAVGDCPGSFFRFARPGVQR